MQCNRKKENNFSCIFSKQIHTKNADRQSIYLLKLKWEFTYNKLCVVEHKKNTFPKFKSFTFAHMKRTTGCEINIYQKTKTKRMQMYKKIPQKIHQQWQIYWQQWILTNCYEEMSVHTLSLNVVKINVSVSIVLPIRNLKYFTFEKYMYVYTLDEFKFFNSQYLARVYLKLQLCLTKRLRVCIWCFISNWY